MLAAQPARQFVTVEQVASLAVYLVSDVSASTTGTIIRSMVDGPRSETLIFQRGLRGF